jgi:hypothetical protein
LTINLHLVAAISQTGYFMPIAQTKPARFFVLFRDETFFPSSLWSIEKKIETKFGRFPILFRRGIFMARARFQEPVFGVWAARSEEFAVKEECSENQKERASVLSERFPNDLRALSF